MKIATHMQSDLDFNSSVRVVMKRNRSYYESIWKTVVKTFRELHKMYENGHPNHKFSLGTFFSLKPFYVHHLSAKDLVMCCCKLHLHARWAVKAMIKCFTKQEIPFPVSDYLNFFSSLYADCENGENTYITWDCTPNKNKVCAHISRNWHELKNIAATSDVNVTVPFTEFMLPCYDAKGQLVKNQKGDPVKRLTPVKEHVLLTC